MKLPFSFGRKKEPIAYYLALLLRDETVSVVVLEEKNTKLTVFTERTILLTTPIEEIHQEELLDTLDKAITTVEAALPKNTNLHKTVFGLKQNWVEEAHIKKEYLGKLKKISDELALTPIGFLVFSEALSHLIQQEEGAPISALLMEIGKQTTSIALIRGGRVTETHIATNEQSIINVAESLLARISSVEILPSRILLFASAESKKTAQQLLEHKWSKELPFLHVPQVTVLALGFDIKAVLHGMATQLGFTPDENYSYDPTNITIETHEIIQKKETEKIHEEEQKITTDNFTAADFGFTTEEDVTKNVPTKITSLDQENKTSTVDEVIAEIPEKVKEEMTGAITNKESFVQDGILITQGAKTFFKTMFSKKQKAYTPPKIKETKNQPIEKQKKAMHKAIIIFPLLAILFVAGILFYIFKEKAIITITVRPKIDTQTQAVIFIADKENNFSNNQIAGITTTLTEEGTLQGQATGKKNVGEKAKGTITIYNSENTDKVISSGTTISSPNGVKFTIDKDIPIASASGDIFSGQKPGIATVSITANDIGTEYNFPSGTKFSFGNSNTIAAKNDTAFSGGTKKEITVISKDDQIKLIDQLTKNLQQKAQTDMSTQAQGEKLLLPIFIGTKVTKKGFDKNVGDQATTITATETIAFQAIAYTKQDVQDFAQTVMKQKMLPDTKLAENGITAEISDAKQKSDTQIMTTMTIHATLYPQIATKQIAQTIKGEPFTKAQNFLTNQPQVSRVTITLQPNIPFLPKLLPRNENNISIIVTNE